MITALQSRMLDANSEELGIPVSKLMRNAGRALAECVDELHPGKRILFVCGTGNNGGDGFAASTHFPKKRCDVAIFAKPKSAVAKKYFGKLKKEPLKFDSVDLDDYDVVVDCVLGTGMHGTVREPYASYINAVNASGKTVVACDMPSGLGADVSINASVTVTFHDIKEGMTEENCGTIIIADIGIPEEASTNVGRGDVLGYPVPRDDSHKGENGRLLIIGGGPYTGAPALSGLAALRVGDDLVRIATPEPSFTPIASASPSFVMHGIEGRNLATSSVDELLGLSELVDAVLIGPGLGTDAETKTAVANFVRRCGKPMVVDADGITAVSEMGPIPRKGIVFTPHRGEFARLSDGRPEAFAKENGCVVVLKGGTDVITDGTRTRYNTTGNPAMTVGGTGDALSGTVAGLLAKGMTPFDAGCLGAYLCGKAGERAFRKYSYGLTAEDLAKEISKVLRRSLDG